MAAMIASHRLASRRHGVIRLVAVALAVALAGSLAPGAAMASQPAEETPDAQGEGPAGQGGAIRATGERLQLGVGDAWTQDMWLWRAGRRAYSIWRKPGTLPKDQNTTHVTAYDLDDGSPVAGADLARVYWNANSNSSLPQGAMARFAAVDEAGGRLFIPYMHRDVDGTTGTANKIESAASDGSRCVIVDVQPSCLAGVFVLDASTLEEVARIPLGVLRVEGGGALTAPQLVGLSYAPPGASDESGKVLLLLSEHYTQTARFNAQNPLFAPNLNATVHYVAQIDPATERVDWTVRAEGCRSTRAPATPAQTNVIPDPYQRRTNETVIFRGGPAGDRAVWVACYQTSRTASIVRIPLNAQGFPADVPVPFTPGDPGEVAGALAADGSVEREQVARPATPGQSLFVGPKEVREYLVDVDSERILARVVDGTPQAAEVWWVFDGRKQAFIGTIGIGAYQHQETVDYRGNRTISGLDPASGRLYVLAPFIDARRSGGLFVTDIRRTPLPQAVVFPEFADLLPPGDAFTYNHVPIQIDYGDGREGTPRRLYVRRGDRYKGDDTPLFYNILEDRLPVTVDPQQDLASGRTLDLPEVDGVTQASFDAAARGFAARAILVGGLSTAGRAGPVDPTLYDNYLGPAQVGVQQSECMKANRQVVVGFVGPRDAAIVDGGGSRGGAEALVVDSGTRSDAELPYSRCIPEITQSRAPVGKLEWERLWGRALVSNPPADEPTVPWLFGDGTTECVSSDEDPTASFGDPVAGAFASRVDCADEEASGFGYARGVGVAGMSVTEAVSSFRIYRDPGRGIVSRVESIARGVAVDGVVRIDSIRGSAESWANGRHQPVADAEREAGYDPNCDFERTAGTCFARHIFGVWTPGYSCGPCGDEHALVEGLSRAMGANGRVRLRDPDPLLRVGSENGYIAAIQKPAHERFGDVVLHDDLLQTVVPVLEIIRYAPTGVAAGAGPARPDGRGMQLYQFAGVEVSTSYGIQCLLVYDAATNTCGAEPVEPGSLRIELTDPDGTPLAGGAFEVRRDVDGDGVLGLVDTLLPDGACVTTDDGTGTCTWDDLEPGAYLISQVAAPPGYAAHDEPWVSQIAPGEARTVTFVNASNISTVEVTVTDEDGAPLSGATFALYADPDGDGTPDGEPVATCTTDADGVCAMAVPVGGYVLVQQSAPGGLEPIEPVAFALTAGGQTAAVAIVNYPPLDDTAGGVQAPPPAAAPEIVFDAPAPFIPVDSGGFTPPADNTSRFTPALPQISDAVGGTIVRVIRAPADAMRLLTRDPKQAVAWMAVMALFALAALAIRRRRTLTGLLSPVQTG